MGLDRLDLRLVLFAALIATAGAFTALQAHGRARECSSNWRVWWLVLAGTSAGAGIWATHFLAIRAYAWDLPIAFNAMGIAASLLVAVIAATVGFALAVPAHRLHAAAGGAVIGLGIVLTHVVGLKALEIPGTIHRNPPLAVPVHVLAVALACAALLAGSELGRRARLWVAAVLMIAAVCGLHFSAVGAVTVVPDPAMVVSGAHLSGSTLAIVIACITALTMIGARIATLASSQSASDAALEMQHRHALLQQREEELSRQNFRFDMALTSMPHGLCMVDAERRLVVCNRRYADMYGLPPEFTRPGTHVSELLDHRIANGIYAGGDVQAYREERLGPVTRASAKSYRLNGGRTVLVSRRPTPDGGWIAIHEDITERRRLEETEREAKEVLDAVFDAVPTAILCIAPDRRVMLWSRGAEHIFGFVSEETVGQPYRLVPADGRAAFEATFERALAGETLRGIRMRLQRKDGSLVDIKSSCAAMRDRDGAVRGIVLALDDLTQVERLNAQLKSQNDLLRQREERLRANNEQLDAALSNMVQGLAMFDKQERLVLANDRYGELYGLRPGETRPGRPLREIVEQRIARGYYPGKTAGQILTGMRERIALGRTSHLISPCEGRVVSTSIQPRPDGGWVVTLHDISELDRLKKQFEVQNVQLEAALNNMVQGLAMFDADMRIVIANGRYAELYGLTPEQVKPSTHLREIVEQRIANGDLAGKTPDQVMQAMLSRVARTGECHYTTRMDDGRYIVVSAKPMANGYTVTTHQDITEQRRSEAKIVHMAMHDALTGLPNRVLFNERLEHGLQRAKRGEIAAVHLLDLDHFKNVNDTLGHPAGDKLLKTATERLRSLVREMDTIARMGGDEFAILQMSIAQPADAGALARRVIDVVSEPYEIDGQQVVIGTSVGIAIGPADGVSPEQLVRNADLALYRAKGDGRGAFCFFEPQMDAQMQERRAMEYDLRKALAAGEFELFYQPIVNLASNRINGFEALIRWHHPEKGLVPPALFIPLAEEIGFIMPLGDWAIRRACETAARWPANVKVAVNLSPVQFRSAGLVQTVVSALASSGLAPGRLELEITETILLQNVEATLAVLYQLREIGVRIAMDDFGTGYSSLSYLQSFPFDRIKIDRSFIKDIADGVGSLNIVRAVAALAAGLGMETTAEGVETEVQRDTVRSEGCTEMQGYLFSAPRPAHEIEQLYLADLKTCEPERVDDALGELPTAARAGAR
jgi:diguanylate cyclase (GGDEF)-like protein/PAS domain S-box-containing protein